MAQSTQSPNVQLARHLGLFEATMIGVGAMIGAGIFVLTGIATGFAGPAAIFAFALNGVVTLFTALSYAELSSAIPEAGGGYAFVKKVMPNAVAFISGWMLWFAYVVACSLYAKGFGSYFLEFFHRYVPSVTDALVTAFGHNAAVGVLTVAIGVLFLGINIAGTHASGKTEDVITLLKLAILAVFIGFGVHAILGDPELTRSNFTPMFPNGLGGVAAAMGLTFIAFEGYDLIATVSEEVKEPRKNIPRAILFSLAITLVVYLLVVFVALGAVPPAEGLPTWQLLGKYGELGIVEAAQSFMPAFGVVLVLAGGLFATLSALNATIMASSRVAFSMGRDWMLPHAFSRIHSIRRTPVMAITLSGALFLVVAVFLPLDTIGTASSLLFLLTFALVNASLILYRRRAPAGEERFRVPLYPLPPVLGILTSLGLAAYQLVNEPLAWTLAMAWVVVGVVVFLGFFSRRASIADVPRAIESPELLTLRNRRGYRILVPLANPTRADQLVEMAGRVAAASRGEVLALTVVDLPTVTSYSDAESHMKEGQRVLERAQRLAIEKQVPLQSLLKMGRDPADDIVSTAREHRCDLILMGYKKDEDPLENSVIHDTIRRQPCDVAVLKGDEDLGGSVDRALLPLGGKEVHDSLKARVVQSLQQEYGTKVTFLFVVPPDAGHKERRQAEAALNHAATIYDVTDPELVLETADDVAEAIIHHAAHQDLLILGMRQEPWLTSFFFGTIAEQVAGRVGCHTLLTKSYSTRKSRVKKLLRR